MLRDCHCSCYAGLGVTLLSEISDSLNDDEYYLTDHDWLDGGVNNYL